MLASEDNTSEAESDGSCVAFLPWGVDPGTEVTV